MDTTHKPAPADRARSLVRQALGVTGTQVESFINSARGKRPDMSDGELLQVMERSYLTLASATGAAAGGVAAAPGVGFVTGGLAAIADVGAFTTLSAIYTLAVASVHKVDVTDIDKRETLILAALIGPQGPAIIAKIAGKLGARWGRVVTDAIPAQTLRAINKLLVHNFITKYGTKQGVLVLGKVLPFGFGAAIGAAGDFAFAFAVTRTLRGAFGEEPPAPEAPAFRQSTMPTPTVFATA